VTEDERTDDQQGMEDVEAHGAKEIAGVGLAAAALIGAGAVGVKLATDDDKSRNQAALVDRSPAERLAIADADKDGYVTYGELAHEGFKYTTEELRSEVDVSAEGLAAAGYKMELGLIGSEDGFPLKENLILLKWGPDPALDELAKGSAAEWTKKIRELDPDDDGYASYDELAKAGHKMELSALNEAFQKEMTAEDLAKAGWKLADYTLGEGGFAVEEGLVMLKRGVDPDLDALFIKGETQG
jgi:hypothetical protein